MSYNPNIPNQSDFLGISQKQMLANFQAIEAAFLRDHVKLTASENIGKHNVLTLRPQGGDPTTSSSQCSIYNKIVSSEPQLFFRPSSNQTPIQLSNSNLNTIQTGAPDGTISSFLAGPFTIYMGFILNCPNPHTVILTPSSTLLFVGLTTNLQGTNTPTTATTAVPVNIVGNQFTISFNGTQITTAPIIYYTAIGI